MGVISGPTQVLTSRGASGGSFRVASSQSAATYHARRERSFEISRKSSRPRNAGRDRRVHGARVAVLDPLERAQMFRAEAVQDVAQDEVHEVGVVLGAEAVADDESVGVPRLEPVARAFQRGSLPLGPRGRLALRDVRPQGPVPVVAGIEEHAGHVRARFVSRGEGRGDPPVRGGSHREVDVGPGHVVVVADGRPLARPDAQRFPVVPAQPPVRVRQQLRAKGRLVAPRRARDARVPVEEHLRALVGRLQLRGRRDEVGHGPVLGAGARAEALLDGHDVVGRRDVGRLVIRQAADHAAPPRAGPVVAEGRGEVGPLAHGRQGGARCC